MIQTTGKQSHAFENKRRKIAENCPFEEERKKNRSFDDRKRFKTIKLAHFMWRKMKNQTEDGKQKT